MDQIIQKENNINSSNRQSTLDTNKNNILYYNNGNYFSFGKDNSLNNKSAPSTSIFNFKENIKKSEDKVNCNISNNNTSFLNKKRKLMTSEELELEQIEREREEVKKMMKKNMELYYRTKSGTTTIVSKIRDTIYNTNNNANKNAILNSYINNNNNNHKNNFLFSQNGSGNNSYVMNFMKEKGINKINTIDKTTVNNNNIIKKEIINIQPTEKIVEIINTDININDKVSIKDDIDNKSENIIDIHEVKEESNNNIYKDSEQRSQIENDEKDSILDNLKNKTPNKESSYLTKMKQLGSMSKLPLCNKIQKYTEICREVLKEQEKEGQSKEAKRKEKKGKTKNKKNKKSHSKKN